MEHEVWFCPVCRAPAYEFAEACEYCGAEFKKRHQSKVLPTILKPKTKTPDYPWSFRKDSKIYSYDYARRGIKDDSKWYPTNEDIRKLQKAEAKLKDMMSTKDREARKMFNLYTKDYQEQFHDLAEPMDFKNYNLYYGLLLMASMAAIILPMYVVNIWLHHLSLGLKTAIMVISWTINMVTIYALKERYENNLKKMQGQWKLGVDIDYVA